MDQALKNLKIQYDVAADVLYCSIGEPQEAIGVEVSDGTVLRLHPETDAVVGITVVDFRRRFVQEPSTTVTIPLEMPVYACGR